MTEGNMGSPERGGVELPSAELWERFFSPAAPLCSDLYREAVADRTILVTGAGGWIGSALCEALALRGARHLLLLDLAEGALYEAHRTLTDRHGMRGPVRVTAILGSVCDEALLRDVISRHRPQVIYHAAAYKHVPLAEQNPFAAMQNNAVGTSALARVAAAYQTPQVIMVSTDKAAEPAGMMGASKRIGELAFFRHNHGGSMRALRLCNVFGSPGSVAPVFESQIAHGGPLTVTHPDAKRYFMTLHEATELLLAALSAPRTYDLWVPDEGGALQVSGLAKFMIGSRDVLIAYEGLRPGDKMEEVLMAGNESRRERLSSGLCAVESPRLAAQEFDHAMIALQQAVAQRNLSLLVSAVQRFVPDYVPSDLIRGQMAAEGEAMR